MEQIEEIKNSGILEDYVLGTATPEEERRVQSFIERYPEIREEVDAMTQTLEQYGHIYAIQPPPQLRARWEGQHGRIGALAVREDRDRWW